MSDAAFACGARIEDRPHHPEPPESERSAKEGGPASRAELREGINHRNSPCYRKADRDEESPGPKDFGRGWGQTGEDSQRKRENNNADAGHSVQASGAWMPRRIPATLKSSSA